MLRFAVMTRSGAFGTTEYGGARDPHISAMLRIAALAFVLLVFLPLALPTARYLLRDRSLPWRSADRSSAGLLPAAYAQSEALVRVFSARTVSWRGIVASHAWIVVKGEGESAYRRFDYTAWGEPIWVDRFVADGRWFGSLPETVFAADGAVAQRMIPLILQAIRDYRYPRPGDYRAWPGPNSNTFGAAVMSAVPGIRAPLPPTAVGKDFPYDGRRFGPTPSGTGLRLNFGGYLGLTLGWVEGIELNVLGAVWGLDVRRPALKLPALGRVGL